MNTLLIEAEAVKCRTMAGARSLVAVGTLPHVPNLVALKTKDGGHLLTVVDAERLAVMLIKAAMSKPVSDD
jgi:hypothetical protein